MSAGGTWTKLWTEQFVTAESDKKLLHGDKESEHYELQRLFCLWVFTRRSREPPPPHRAELRPRCGRVDVLDISLRPLSGSAGPGAALTHQQEPTQHLLTHRDLGPGLRLLCSVSRGGSWSTSCHVCLVTRLVNLCATTDHDQVRSVVPAPHVSHIKHWLGLKSPNVGSVNFFFFL